MDTKLYEVINPSDAMTMRASSIEIAAAACAMLGGGKIGAREVSGNDDAERTPVLFGWDEWLRDRSMMPLGPWILAHQAEIVAALRSVMLGSPNDRAMGTITAIDHHALCIASTGPDRHPGAERVASFLTSYYSGGGTAHSLAEPMPTVTATARHGLVRCTMTGRAIVDIGMRMLTPRELARGMGFPDSYVLEPATIAEQIRAIGNSVCPPVAAALIRANLPKQRAGVA